MSYVPSSKFDEVEIVGPAAEIASFRHHMGEQTRFIVEETPLRIRAALDRDDINFLGDFDKEVRRTNNGKIFIFLRERDLNSNLGDLASALNR